MTPRRPRARPALLGSLALAALGASCSKSEPPPTRPAVGCSDGGAGPFGPPPTGVTIGAFHQTTARLGWLDGESALTPAAVSGGTFGARWSSPPLDHVTLNGADHAPHLYASPLYLDDVPFAGSGCDALTLSAVFVATSNGYAYAVNAFDATVNGRSVTAGTVLWRTSLGPPAVIAQLDGGMALGVLSTPIVDRAASRLYVTSLDADHGWRAWALDLGSGAPLPGWPVTLDAAAVEPVNANGPATFADGKVLSQRAALTLSPSGDRLYVPFGAYFDGGVGWMVVLDTRAPRVLASFAGAPDATNPGAGGIWSAGGPAVDDAGRLYATVGNTRDGLGPTPRVWGESLLAWSADFALSASYTPFNYCALDASDSDIGGGSPVLLPDLSASGTTTPHLVAFGGKQGVVYLVDRDHLPGGVAARPPCGTDSAQDGSLLPPAPQPGFAARGPLSVFGPYSEQYNDRDRAKMRSTPAYFADANGTYLFVSGSTKAAVDSPVSVAPSLARLRVVTPSAAPSYLTLDAYGSAMTFVNPGSPVVTSHGPDGPVVWVLDENAPRTASLLDPNAPHPVLYAIDGATLGVLWQSAPGELEIGGKYSSVAVAHGRVFVGTDRVRAYGLP